MYQGIPGECDHSQTGVESPYLWFSGAPKSQKTIWGGLRGKGGGGVSLLNQFVSQHLQPVRSSCLTRLH